MVTIQNPIRKTVANATQFTHVVTSPYKLCQMSLRMRAFDVHIVIICMALNSYILFFYPAFYPEVALYKQVGYNKTGHRP